MQGSSGGGIRRIGGWHNKNTGQVENLGIASWDITIFNFGDIASRISGEWTRYEGFETDPGCGLGYLGGRMEAEVTRIVMYWVPE